MRKYFQSLFILFLSILVFPVIADDAPPPAKAIYFAISEPFTIDFLNQSNKEARYLQIKVTLMAHEQTMIDEAELNLPMIQDALRTLFSGQTWQAVNAVEGRRALQLASLETVNSILKAETGQDNIQAIYFTSFILQ